MVRLGLDCQMSEFYGFLIGPQEMPVSVFQEEAIELAIELTRHHLTYSVFPNYHPRFRRLPPPGHGKGKGAGHNDAHANAVEDDDDVDEEEEAEEESAGTKRGRKGKGLSVTPSCLSGC